MSACLLSSGVLRALSSAPFSFCAARSAFRAAAVVTATLDVSSAERVLGLEVASAEGSPLRLRTGELMLSRATRGGRRSRSRSACEMIMLMFL